METQVCTQKEKSSDGKLQELLEDLSLGFRGKKTCGHGELTAKKSGSRGLERVLRTQPAGWMRQPRGRGAGRALAPSEGCLFGRPPGCSQDQDGGCRRQRRHRLALELWGRRSLADSWSLGFKGTARGRKGAGWKPGTRNRASCSCSHKDVYRPRACWSQRHLRTCKSQDQLANG